MFLSQRLLVLYVFRHLCGLPDRVSENSISKEPRHLPAAHGHVTFLPIRITSPARCWLLLHTTLPPFLHSNFFFFPL